MLPVCIGTSWANVVWRRSFCGPEQFNVGPLGLETAFNRCVISVAWDLLNLELLHSSPHTWPFHCNWTSVHWLESSNASVHCSGRWWMTLDPWYPDQKKVLEETTPIIWYLILQDLIYSPWNLYIQGLTPGPMLSSHLLEVNQVWTHNLLNHRFETLSWLILKELPGQLKPYPWQKIQWGEFHCQQSK